MRERTVATAALVLVAISLAATSSAPASNPAPSPSVITSGAVGRTVLSGWSFRADPTAVGESSGWWSGGGSGWVPVTVPSDFNSPRLDAVDDRGSVGWYRTTFDSSTAVAVVRFEAIGGAAVVWLNGQRVAERSHMYGLPLEVELRSLRASGNVLVVEVDSRPRKNSLPSMAYRPGSVVPISGWWNWGGLLREVSMRPAGDADIRWAGLSSRLTCLAAGCPFAATVSAEIVNTSSRQLNVSISGTLGERVLEFAPRLVAAGATSKLQASVEVPADQAWSPSNPRLLKLSLRSQAAQATGSEWVSDTGVRDVRVTRRSIFLNGSPIRLWGLSLHEESAANGGAPSQSDLEDLWSQVRASGANVIRSHYPLNPWLLQQADREGVMVWDQIPVWEEPIWLASRADVREAAQQALIGMIRRDHSNPSVITWSLGNELWDHPTSAEWTARGAQVARSADPTRPVSIDVKAGDALSTAWNPVDLLGVNIYNGWYGRGGSPSSIGGMIGWYRSRRPGQALVATEFGAEATSIGPSQSRGGEGFQRSYLLAALNSLASVNTSGGILWLLRDFACRPTWTGGNVPAFATPPFNNKGLLRRDGTPKLSWQPVTDRLRTLPGRP